MPAAMADVFPGVDIAETGTDYRITAELPGVEEKDIDVSLAEDVLTIKGEKRHESEQKAEGRVVSERRFGAFERSFTLPQGTDAEKIMATFKNGVLTVAVPKLPQAAPERKRISVKAA
jgi:HSP20 family protein